MIQKFRATLPKSFDPTVVGIIVMPLILTIAPSNTEMDKGLLLGISLGMATALYVAKVLRVHYGNISLLDRPRLRLILGVLGLTLIASITPKLVQVFKDYHSVSTQWSFMDGFSLSFIWATAVTPLGLVAVIFIKPRIPKVDWEKRFPAIKRIRDQAVKYKGYILNFDWDARFPAIKWIRDQAAKYGRYTLGFIALALAICAIVLSFQFTIAYLAPASVSIITGKFSAMAVFTILKMRYGDYVGDIFAKRFLYRTAYKLLAITLTAVSIVWFLRIIYDTFTVVNQIIVMGEIVPGLSSLSFIDGFLPGFILFGALLLRGSREEKQKGETQLAANPVNVLETQT